MRCSDEFDHYALYTGDAEVVTKEEIIDDNRFLKNVMKTRPMKIAHRYLAREGLVPPNKVSRQCLQTLVDRLIPNNT